MTKCEDIQEWEIDKYRIVKSSCLGYAGPRYYPISFYIGEKEVGNGSQIDSCIFTWQTDNESFLILNVCNNSIQEINPHKVLLDVKAIDSVTILSRELTQIQLLTDIQIEKFVTDWNNSKTRGYSDKAFDSASSVFPAYQYRLTVFAKGSERPFYGYNFLILDSSNWRYEMSKTAELDYFHNYWKK